MIKTEAYNDSQQFLGLTRKNGVKAGKLYVQKPLNVASAFDVDRNLAAYRLNQEGVLELMGVDVPRIDYKNTCPELLVENEATNRVLQSEDFATTWAADNLTITTNSTNAPNDATTADTLTPNTTNGVHRVQQSVAVVGQVNAMSVFAKPNGYDWIMLENGGEIAYFNVSNGTVGTVSGGIGYTELVNGYYRCVFVCTALNTKTNIYVASANNTFVFAGDDVKGVIVWGAQSEVTLTNRATSYIPTTTVAVTRPADKIDNGTFGYNNDTSTIFIRARLEFSENIQGLITLSDGGVLDDYMSLWIVESGGDKLLAIDTYTNPDQNTIYVTLPDDGVYSIALGYNLLTAEYSLAVNGVIESSGTFVNPIPSSAPLTTMQLGRINTNYDARVIGFMYFDSKLDDTSLENLTTI